MAGTQARGPVRFRVVDSEEGTLLFNLIARRMGTLSPQEGRDLIKAGGVYVGHLRVRVPTVRVVPGERITVYPEALEHRPLPASAVKFVHRDPCFVVLDKPAGVPVAQTKQSSRGTLSEVLRRVLAQEGMKRPYVGLVHRLDHGASGLVLFTIRDIANKSVHRQFVEHSIEREYRVMVHGDPPATLTCDAPLLERKDGRVAVAEAGQPKARDARTRFERLQPRVDPGPNRALLCAQLETGRTHQIRVHAAHLGHPVVGDTKYSEAADDGELKLHAHRMAFDHPLSGERIEVSSTPPDWAATDA